MAVEAFFLPVGRGQRFCLFHPPAQDVTAAPAVLFVHAFAEEMNKSRALVARQARALAAAGHGVLQMDLLGCGDSSGDFGDADWDAWVQDVVDGADWLRRRSPGELWLWGHRLGCLLAGAAAPRLEGPINFLFWQPVVSGRQFLQQVLRLGAAGEMLDGQGRGAMERLRRQLADGRSVEIAGYALAPGLTRGLDAAELLPPPLPGRTVEWFEISAREDAELSPVARQRLEAWREAGYRARGHVVAGAPFWQTVEIEDCPALVDASLAALAGRP
jgi:exosortase A-associated hydrolase 2